jgi:ATP-dependent protease ClpP protease subunit
MTGSQAIEYWHYAKDGEAAGPVPRADLTALLRSGTLPLATPVWRAGFSDWQPASAAFMLADPRSRIPWLRVAPLVTLAGLAAALSLSLLFIADPILNVAEPDQVSTVWSGFVALTAAVGVLAVAVLWRYAPSLGRANPASALPGTARAAAIVLAVLVAAFVTVGVAAIPQLNNLVAVRSAYDDYAILYDEKTDTLRIDGVIGPRFASSVEKAMEERAVRRIAINSEGGLIAEAMAAARIIEPHNIEILVQKSCHSACLIVFAAGAKRYAHLGATFGFHAAAPIIASETDLIKDEATEADEYMVARGAPRDIVDEANRLGTETMRIAWSVELMQRGFVTNVYDSNEVALPLPAEIARWRAVELALEDEYWPTAESLHAIRDAAPNQVTRHADELDLPTSADITSTAEAAHRLVVSLRRDALQAAGDDAVANYFNVYRGTIDSFVNEGDWENCAAFVNSPASVFGNSAPARFELAGALGRLIKSAEDRDWTEKEAARDTAAAYEAINAEADLAMLAQQDGDGDRLACLRASTLAQSIAALDDTKAAALFRYADRFRALSK